MMIIARLVENFDIARLVQKAGGCQELECPICLEEMRPPVIVIIIFIIVDTIWFSAALAALYLTLLTG